MAKEKNIETSVNEVLESAENVSPVDQEVIEVIFIVSPTGKFGLAYNVGETGSFNQAQATELVESGYAELVK